MRIVRVLSHSVLSLLIVSGLSTALMSSPVSAHATSLAPDVPWLWPVEGEHSIRLDYQAPLTEYSRGHRGIDLAADVGREVRAPAAGIITFAGAIAGRGVLSMRVDSLLLSFEAVSPVVSEGDEVFRGQVIATVAIGSHCDECLHVGVRRNGLYLSPLRFLTRVPLSNLELWNDEHWAHLPPAE